MQTKNYSEAKLQGISDLIIGMLDYDGATVVDNAGRIRAYNVFVEVKARANVKPIGGARRRAAQSLVDSKNKKFIGVYFQSQDGDCFFKYTKTHQQKIDKKVGESARPVQPSAIEGTDVAKGQISIVDMMHQNVNNN